MKYLPRYYCLFVLFAFALIGCGGGDEIGITNSIFAENWSGPWNDPQNNQNGTIHATLTTNGRFTGTIINNTLTAQGNFNGTINDAGEVDITITYTNVVTRSRGTVTRTNNQMTGTLQTVQHNTVIGSINLTLTRQ